HREGRAILARLELRFRERVVVRDMRPGVSLRHAEVGEQRATGLDVMAAPRSVWMVSCPGPMLCLAHVSAMNRSATSRSHGGHHPADDVPADYVEHDVQVQEVHFAGSSSIRHRYIQPRRPDQNGKVERSHRVDAEEFWGRSGFATFEAAD